jgi:hypothetical protein
MSEDKQKINKIAYKEIITREKNKPNLKIKIKSYDC